ncbi:MAG: HAD family hydrolase [bacterium]
MNEDLKDSTRAAVFDVDYTVLQSNSASLFVKFLRQEGQVGVGTILLSLYYLLRYKLNLLDFENLAAREVAKFRGMEEREMIELCERWFREMVVDYIYPEAVDLINRHKSEGDRVALLTAATIYLGEPLGRHLGIKHCLCNRLEVDEQGRFTGNLVTPVSYGAGKIRLAESFASETGVDLTQSLYYSDSITDLPVLEKFGHPVAVNPDPLLRKEARQRGWPIMEFKKSSKG